MSDSITAFMSHVLQVIIYAMGILLALMGISMCLNYLQAYTIKNNAENFMLDMMTYATKHNGFNDPARGGYTFRQTEQDMLRRHNMTDYIESVRYEPSPGTQVEGRSGEISMTIVYKYPTISPLDSSSNMSTSIPRTVTDVVHGYVKEPDKGKEFDKEKPWWLWEDEEWPPR